MADDNVTPAEQEIIDTAKMLASDVIDANAERWGLTRTFAQPSPAPPVETVTSG